MSLRAKQSRVVPLDLIYARLRKMSTVPTNSGSLSCKRSIMHVKASYQKNLHLIKHRMKLNKIFSILCEIEIHMGELMYLYCCVGTNI